MQKVTELDLYYHYGYQGRAMIAGRAPYAMAGDGAGLMGRTVRAGGSLFQVLAISRQISGPIAAGEPIGLEVCPVASTVDA